MLSPNKEAYKLCYRPKYSSGGLVLRQYLKGGNNNNLLYVEGKVILIKALAQLMRLLGVQNKLALASIAPQLAKELLLFSLKRRCDTSPGMQ